MINRLLTRKNLKILIAGLILWSGVSVASGQTTVSIGTQIFCENSFASVPVQVTGFHDVAAFTLYLSIDTLMVKFQSIQNPHQSLSGGIIVSNFVPSLSQIIIAWQSMNAATIESGKLFDISVQFLQGPTLMEFLPSCEIVKNDLSIVQNVTYENGMLDNALRIFAQPQAITVTEGEIAQFSISTYTSEALSYQWQVNNGTGWSDLNEIPPYFNVKTSQLQINPVSLSLNNHLYRCRITFDNCTGTSDHAMLTVMPLSVVLNPHSKVQGFHVYPIPATKAIMLEIDNYEAGMVVHLINLEGKIIKTLPVHNGHQEISLQEVPRGNYLITLFGKNIPLATQKIPVL